MKPRQKIIYILLVISFLKNKYNIYIKIKLLPFYAIKKKEGKIWNESYHMINLSNKRKIKLVVFASWGISLAVISSKIKLMNSNIYIYIFKK